MDVFQRLFPLATVTPADFKGLRLLTEAAGKRFHRGVVLYRRLLLEQIERLRRGEDPLAVVRDPEKNRLIELPQERNKYHRGKAFLAESLEMGHVRYSPLKDLIPTLLGQG